MNKLWLLLGLLSSAAFASDLELNLPIGAKFGSGYGFDYQATKPNKNGSFGLEGGKWADKVFYLGPTYDYSVTNFFSADIAVVATRDHGSIKPALIPELQLQIWKLTLDVNYLQSTVKDSSGIGFSLGYHF